MHAGQVPLPCPCPALSDQDLLVLMMRHVRAERIVGEGSPVELS